MITINVNSVDHTSDIVLGSLEVIQRLTSEVDSARFQINKAGDRTFSVSYGDDIEVYDGSTKIFGGIVLTVRENPISGGGGVVLDVECVDHTYQMDKLLASKTYEDETIEDIIDDLISSYASGFTANSVSSTFVVEKIVFNQVPLSTCLKRLASIVQYDWYVDEDKDIHFFPKFTNTAPFGLTDTNGNYVYKSLERVSDGSQVANRVKVRGGEYEGDLFSDSITVVGNDTKSFKLPYKFANLTITLDTGGGPVAQDVGIDFSDDFTSDDVLYNYQAQTIRWENNLSDGDVIAFSGNPKIPVFAISEDPISIAAYGINEKLIRDTSIESNAVARRRANAELYAYAEPIIDAKFFTRTAGLRVGMLITAQSDQRGFDDDLLIKQITFKQIDHQTFGYKVDLVSTKRFNFIAMLQSILEPDPRPGDEAEASEQIFTDTQIITIQEEIENVSAQEDTSQEVEAQENYEIDPLGAGTNATYVLSPYTPSGQSDTKRPGRIGISFELA